MTHYLAGLASITPLPLTRASFLIPFFKNIDSNLIFAQELGVNRRIAEFRLFDPFKYHVLNRTCERIQRAVGNIGVVSYFHPEDDITTAPADIISKRLATLEWQADDSPFFEIEVGYFIGDLGRIRNGISRASLTFQNRSGFYWKRTEDSLARIPSNLRTPEVKISSIWLKLNFSDPEWHLHWQDAWRQSTFDEHLTELGLDFVEGLVEAQKIDSRMTFVLGSIIRYPRCLVSDTLKSRAKALTLCYLTERKEEARQTTGTLEDWGRIFLNFVRLGEKLTEDDQKEILEFLTRLAQSRRTRTLWRDMWETLWISKSYRQEALQILNDLFTRAHVSSSFLRDFMNAILRNLNDEELHAPALNWLQNSVFSNTWIKLYIKMLVVLKNSAELLEVGKHWLRMEPGKLKRWSDVYFAITERYGEDEEMLELARAWLIRSNRSMGSWPRMAMHVAKLGGLMHPELAQTIRLWLSEKHKTSKAWDLHALLRDQGFSSDLNSQTQ